MGVYTRRNQLTRVKSVALKTMASSRQPGLLPDEVAFLCGMELVTIIPRQRLEGLELIGVYLSHPAYGSIRINCDRATYHPSDRRIKPLYPSGLPFS
jgi:hypothetical protein